MWMRSLRFGAVWVLGLCAVASAAEVSVSLAGDSASRRADRFFSFELCNFGAGIGSPHMFTRMCFLPVTWTFGRVELGLAAAEGISGIQAFYGDIAALPVHVGCVIARKPKRTAFFYSMAPSLTVEAAAGIAPSDMYVGYYTRLSVAWRYEFYGIGAGVEAGVSKTFNSYYDQPAIFAVARVHFVSASVRL